MTKTSTLVDAMPADIKAITAKLFSNVPIMLGGHETMKLVEYYAPRHCDLFYGIARHGISSVQACREANEFFVKNRVPLVARKFSIDAADEYWYVTLVGGPKQAEFDKTLYRTSVLDGSLVLKPSKQVSIKDAHADLVVLMYHHQFGREANGMKTEAMRKALLKTRYTKVVARRDGWTELA